MNHFSFLDPTLVVEVNPTTQTVLDVYPYNVILVTCNAVLPQAVNISKGILWEQVSPSGTMQTLTHNGIDVNITSAGLSRSASTSMLSLYATTAGRWGYTCNAHIQVAGDPLISYSQTAEVIVKGEIFIALSL